MEGDPANAVEGDIPIIHIEPSRGSVSLRLREVWEYKGLL